MNDFTPASSRMCGVNSALIESRRESIVFWRIRVCAIAIEVRGVLVDRDEKDVVGYC